MKNNPTDPQHRSAFTTSAQAEFRRRNTRRLAAAAAAAVAILVILVLLGPDQQSIKRKFEYYGKPDELKIMPEVSIDNGADRIHQLPKSLQKPPPPSFVETEREDLDPRAEEEIPVTRERQPRPVNEPSAQVDPNAETASRDQVELKLPSQTNPDWYIIKQVRPEYPLGASEAERRLPVVFVKAAIFVGPDGTVLEKMILATNGGRAFAREVLDALGQWKFGWRVDPGQGRWIEMTWNFKSPYFSVNGG